MKQLLSKRTKAYLNKKIKLYLECGEQLKGIIIHKYDTFYSQKRYAELMIDDNCGLMLAGNIRWRKLEPEKLYTFKELGLRSEL